MFPLRRSKSKDEEEQQDSKSNHAPSQESHSNKGASHSGSQSSKTSHNPSKRKDDGKRTVAQAALAGLPKFFAKEKHRVVTSSIVQLKASKTWSIRLPPVKKHYVKSTGHFVPSAASLLHTGAFRQPQRRLVLEIHGPPAAVDEHKSVASTIAFSRTPLKDGMMEKLLRTDSGPVDTEDQIVLDDDDVVVVRIMRRLDGDEMNDRSSPRHHQDLNARHQDDDVSLLDEDADDDSDDKEYGSYRLEDVELLKRHGRTCEMKLSAKIIRDFKFAAERHAMSFQKVLNHAKELEVERMQRRADMYREIHGNDNQKNKQKTSPRSRDLISAFRQTDSGDFLDDEDARINLLIEIVSATDLPVADVFSTDAYVKVRMGGIDVHRTKAISKSLDPVWTLESDALFLLKMTPEEFFHSSNGMAFIIKDYDAVGSNEVLGRVLVSHKELLEGTGERKGFEIVPENSTVLPISSSYQRNTIIGNSGLAGAEYGKKKPMLYLRIKHATQQDVEVSRIE